MIINNYYLQTSLINKEPDPCPLATLPSLIPTSSQLVLTLSPPHQHSLRLFCNPNSPLSNNPQIMSNSDPLYLLSHYESCYCVEKGVSSRFS